MKKARHSPFRYQLAHRLQLSVWLKYPPYPTGQQLKRISKVALMPSVRQAWVSLLITDEEQSYILNSQWRHKKCSTNVLSFPLSEPTSLSSTPTHLMGDLVLCAPIIAQEARAQNKTLLAHYAHLIIHGMLHLQGYHHEDNETDAATMRQLETSMLAQLGYANPYENE